MAEREPKYYTVKRHLAQYIDGMNPGNPVPPERELSERLNTSRTTVRQALAELVAEGRLVRRQGSGTYVADPKIIWPLHLTSFTQQAEESGWAPSSSLLGADRVRADAELAERLSVAIGDDVHQIERLRLANGTPMAVETAYLPAARFPYLGRRIRAAVSLHATLAAEYGVEVYAGEEWIDTVPASPREAALLQADVGSPLLVVRRRSFDRDGAPVEWGTSRFRGDRITLMANLNSTRR